MEYLALHIVLNKAEEADLLTGLLSKWDFEGFEEQDHLLIAYIPSDRMPPENDLKQVLKNYHYTFRDVPDQNWNAVWEKHFEPIVIDSFCGIRADFHPAFENMRYEIVINPRMAFGTGHHATTRMMIRLMEKLNLTEKKILDFGTGTGILSILASMMGAEKVIAIDNDPNAVNNAAQNIQENKSSGISIFCQDHPDTGEPYFDVILANINRNIILNNWESLLKLRVKDGILILSGFLQTDMKLLRQTIHKSGMHIEKIIKNGDWAALQVNQNTH